MRSLREDPPAVLGVRAVEPHHDRDAGFDPLQRLEDALRHEVASRDPSEDVHEHDLHGRVREHDLERGRHLIGRRTASDVEEVRGAGARLRHDVERRHHEPGTVADDAHLSVELHVLEALLLRARLHLVDRELLRKLRDVRMTPQGVVVDRHLRVERHDPIVVEKDERVHLDEGRVALDERARTSSGARRPAPSQASTGSVPIELAHVIGAEPEHRVDVHAPERFGSRAGELLDVHRRPLPSSSRGSRPGSGPAGATCRTPARSAAAPRRGRASRRSP